MAAQRGGAPGPGPRQPAAVASEALPRRALRRFSEPKALQQCTHRRTVGQTRSQQPAARS
jgi:hypothetical protein